MNRVFWAIMAVIIAAFLALFIDGVINAEAIEPEEPQVIACDSEPVETITVQEFMGRVADAWESFAKPSESDSEDESDGECYEEYYEYQNWDYADYSGSQYSYAPSGYEATNTEDLLGWQGRTSDGEYSYTWFYHDIGYGPLDVEGEHFDENGISYDGDGYIVVASDDYAVGDVVDTPYGEGRVYCGGSTHGTIDLYTNR